MDTIYDTIVCTRKHLITAAYRLRVVPFCLIFRAWPHEILGASQGHFFLAAFFCITEDGLGERGTIHSLPDYGYNAMSFSLTILFTYPEMFNENKNSVPT